MATTYDEMVTLVRGWSNRDEESLPREIIEDCLRWAADKAYRTLRVPPLEKTVYYPASMLRDATSSTNNRQASVTSLSIPTDLIEFIHIRGVDEDYRTTRMFNEKADIRTFWDRYAEKYSDLAVWARQGDQVFLSPGFGIQPNYGSLGITDEAGVEMYYYGRLPALNARYNVDAEQFNILQFDNISSAGPAVGSTNGFITRVADVPEGSDMVQTGTQLFLRHYTLDLEPDDPNTAMLPEIMLVAFDTPEAAAAFSTMVPDYILSSEASTGFFTGNETPHWLRDENERVLLMGALAEVFFYLQEDDQAQKYSALFQQEIAELNNEDVMRNASGGNVQVNFNGRGLI